MKRKLFNCSTVLLAAAVFSGCANNQQTITADHGSRVTCTGSVDKPVNLERLVDAEGNEVPLVP